MAGSAGMSRTDLGTSKVLLLAAEDMRQAATGARFLQGLRVETDETMTRHQYDLIHVLETGVVVAYMRPFTQSHTYKPLSRDESVPPEWHAMHDELKELRDKVYAHTDDHPSRDASFTFGGDAATGVSGYAFNVHTVGLRPERLVEIVTLCDEQAATFGSVALMHNLVGVDIPDPAE
jgi:hypothetical protein